ncbi:hypothetical protein [Falsiroseomonas sp.]|uniref:hypothetical protein n=1 Tax=Falsiroseomonas sp. TaxID=2870721 RepID=UPI0034A407B4
MRSRATAALLGVLAVSPAAFQPASAQPRPAAEQAVGGSVSAAEALSLLGVEMLLLHLARPQPFARQLGVARLLAREDAALLALLDGLDGLADRGAPTFRMLAADFPAAADLSIMAEAGLDDAGLLGRMAAATMRVGAGIGRAGTPALEATRVAVARLAEGDLAAADAALAVLDGTPGAAIMAWRDGAAARMRADATAARLAELVAARLRGAP